MARTERGSVGINYGRLGDDLPSPQEAVAVIKSMKVFNQVKIYDSDPLVLTALSHSGLRVVMAATNEELATLASSTSAAVQWLAQRVLPHFPFTRIRVITVGNELLSHPEMSQSWPLLVPAMQNLQSALDSAGLRGRIKLSTCIAMDALNASYPPSAGIFRPDIADNILRPVLELVKSTNSYLFVNAYPYLAWSENTDTIPLDYALSQTDAVAVQDGSLHYSSMLDAQVDSFLAAMAALGFPDVKIAVSETGWPNGGGPGASVANAAAFNGRLINSVMAAPCKGTPRRPGACIPTFIFALFNENQKPGAATERFWGILYPNATQIYTL